MNLFEESLKKLMNDKLAKLEHEFDADVIFFYGEIHTSIIRPFRDLIEDLKKPSDTNKLEQKKLVIILNTPGGSAEAVEKLVDIIRHHYTDVSFVVPDFAMSAGTIFCMSGNRIYMDYSSSLGPIDPQVWNGKQWVPARGYLDKIEEMFAKAAAGTLSNAEFLILQNQDLAMLSQYEQAKNLTVTLLKKWLVEYKWQDWNTHQSTPSKIGQPVTPDEKTARAEEVAKTLGDNKYWHSHGRMIGIGTLRNLIKIKIEDYSGDVKLQPIIRSYNDLITEWIAKIGVPTFVHTRLFSKELAMTIEEKIKKALAQSDSKGPDNLEFQRLREFYEEKKKEGIVKKQEYTLPPIDTIGRIFYTRCREEEERQRLGARKNAP